MFQPAYTGWNCLSVPLSSMQKKATTHLFWRPSPFGFAFFPSPCVSCGEQNPMVSSNPPKTCRSVSGSGQEIVHTFKKRGSMGYISPRFGRFEFWTYHPSFSLMFPFQFASLFISIAIAMGYDPFSNKPPYIVGSNPAYHKVCYTSDDGAIFSYFFHAGYHR